MRSGKCSIVQSERTTVALLSKLLTRAQTPTGSMPGWRSRSCFFFFFFFFFSSSFSSTSTSALHIACKLGHTKIALLLLQRGADVNMQTKTGWIPMHFAVNTGLVELVELLNANGGRADIVNEWMKTPLDIAKERKNEEMLEVLKRRPGAVAPAPAPVVPTTPQQQQQAAALSLTPRAVSGGGSVRGQSSSSSSPSSSVPGGWQSAGAIGQVSKSPPLPPSKSPRAHTIVAPTEAAPLPPTAKPLPAPPTEGAVEIPATKVRSIRGAGERASGADWVEATPNKIKGSSGSISGPSSRVYDAEIAKLNREVASLKTEVEGLKEELARVMTYLQGVDL